LAANDVLVAIDGLRASTSVIESLLADRVPGERLTVHAFRRDELFSVELELAPAPLDTCYLTLREDCPESVLKRRGQWLARLDFRRHPYC
jgi:predicted metalloprotease with PDZ domain